MSELELIVVHIQRQEEYSFRLPSIAVVADLASAICHKLNDHGIRERFMFTRSDGKALRPSDRLAECHTSMTLPSTSPIRVFAAERKFQPNYTMADILAPKLQSEIKSRHRHKVSKYSIPQGGDTSTTTRDKEQSTTGTPNATAGANQSSSVARPDQPHQQPNANAVADRHAHTLAPDDPGFFYGEDLARNFFLCYTFVDFIVPDFQDPTDTLTDVAMIRTIASITCFVIWYMVERYARTQAAKGNQAFAFFTKPASVLTMLCTLFGILTQSMIMWEFAVRSTINPASYIAIYLRCGVAVLIWFLIKLVRTRGHGPILWFPPVAVRPPQIPVAGTAAGNQPLANGAGDAAAVAAGGAGGAQANPPIPGALGDAEDFGLYGRALMVYLTIFILLKDLPKPTSIYYTLMLGTLYLVLQLAFRRLKHVFARIWQSFKARLQGWFGIGAAARVPLPPANGPLDVISRVVVGFFASLFPAWEPRPVGAQ